MLSEDVDVEDKTGAERPVRGHCHRPVTERIRLGLAVVEVWTDSWISTCCLNRCCTEGSILRDSWDMLVIGVNSPCNKWPLKDIMVQTQ